MCRLEPQRTVRKNASKRTAAQRRDSSLVLLETSPAVYVCSLPTVVYAVTMPTTFRNMRRSIRSSSPASDAALVRTIYVR
ncbi:unnamed protein product [Nippostrongylus brasiliensis]|uniref:Uncharacterized protein n=1 Tax=Nippostrongylus brasiliensis TaxID=27835 RepID=A0A0N4XNJ2_NIPBR|nr:unnamed protein product [Nippostrongylus brasiliensis]